MFFEAIWILVWLALLFATSPGFVDRVSVHSFHVLPRSEARAHCNISSSNIFPRKTINLIYSSDRFTPLTNSNLFS